MPNESEITLCGGEVRNVVVNTECTIEANEKSLILRDNKAKEWCETQKRRKKESNGKWMDGKMKNKTEIETNGNENMLKKSKCEYRYKHIANPRNIDNFFFAFVLSHHLFLLLSSVHSVSLSLFVSVCLCLVVLWWVFYHFFSLHSCHFSCPTFFFTFVLSFVSFRCNFIRLKFWKGIKHEKKPCK